MAAYTKVDIPFEVENVGIDTFLIPTELLKSSGYEYRAPVYELLEDGKTSSPYQNIGRYISMEHLVELVSDTDEATIVLNIQVGNGKSQACYDLIKEYCKDDDKVILMVSPFKKLVEKDYTALSSAGLKPFNYMQLPKDDSYDEVLTIALESKVHVMTINCLLGNPGEDSFAQAFVKSNYLTSLHKKCRDEQKEVVIFFDEIHESVPHFAAHLFPNLYRWSDVVKKCFVSSGTYTIALYPVLKYIALLTNKTIIEFHVQRHKWPSECISNLHLHIITEEYSSSQLEPLHPLKSILKDSTGKQVNILTAHKAIAKALLKPRDSRGKENPFHEALMPFHFNEVHGDSDKRFDEKGNNIGTTFKTGVNIDNPNSVLIIILPVIKQNSSGNAFYDGAPSINQSLARQRKGGVIHILMYDPVYLIEPAFEEVEENSDNGLGGYTFFTSYKSLQNRLDALLTANKKVKHHIDQRMALDILAGEYNARHERNRELIDALRKSEADGTTKLGFQYPSFEQYLMDEGVHLLTRNYPQFGGDLSSYVLWAAMNSQFVSASLRSISYYTATVKDIRLTSIDMKASITRHLHDGTTEMLKRTSLKTVQQVVGERLHTSKFVSMDGEREVIHNALHRFTLDGEHVSFGKLVRDPRYLNALIEITLDANGITYQKEDLKWQYITQNMTAALGVASNSTPVIDLWQELYGIREEFITYCNSRLIVAKDNTMTIHGNSKVNMPMEIAQAMKAFVVELRRLDVFIGSKAVSFLQKIEDKDGEQLRDMVYTELRDLFTNITTNRTGSGKDKNMLFKIDGTLDKTLPDNSILKTI